MDRLARPYVWAFRLLRLSPRSSATESTSISTARQPPERRDEPRVVLRGGCASAPTRVIRSPRIRQALRRSSRAMTWCSRGVSPDHVESQIYESARMLDLRCHHNSPKSIKSGGTSLGFDCDMESNKTCPPNAPVPCDDGLSAFLSVRPRLFGIAYRMLHSPAEAEDIVQDVWVRWQTTDRRIVRDAAAFLVTSATRLAINVLQSARSRRETHVSPWLPEPIDAKSDPGQKGRRAAGAGVWGTPITGEAVARRTSRIHPSGSVRLCLP